MSSRQWLADRRERVERDLGVLLSEFRSGPETLVEGMRYAVLSGGKRVRPLLVLAACRLAGGAEETALPTACAVELIHCYSLVHDDLPCMDDDDLRRGQPTTHKVYGEALAVLIGDALLTLAFEAVASTQGVDPPRVMEVVTTLARAAGAEGMVAGQVVDMEAEANGGDLAMLESMHGRKTGRLIRGSLRAGGLLADASADLLERLDIYGRELGLLYQITDDLLDAQGTTQIMGKAAGADQRRGKLTYPGLLGVEGTRKLVDQTATCARRALAGVQGSELLLYMLDLVCERNC